MTAFPLDLHAQLLIGSTWTDADVDPAKAKIAITRGRSDESGTVQPSTCDLSLHNVDGKYSNRNPRSIYFGQLGRNTQLRTIIGRRPSGSQGSSTSTTTSHDAPSVAAGAAGRLFCMWLAAGVVNYTVPGGLTAGTERDGPGSTSQTGHAAISIGPTGTQTATASAATGYAAVSVVAYGASTTVQESLSSVGRVDATLTTSTSTQAGWWLVAMAGWHLDDKGDMPFAPEGGPGGEWSLLTDTGQVQVSSVNIPHIQAWARPVESAGAQTVIFRQGGQSGNDIHARVFVVSGVDFFSSRFWGEMAAQPPKWTATTDVWTPIQGAGIMRRLTQGASPLRSPLRRAITSRLMPLYDRPLTLVAYWPMEDGSSVRQFRATTTGTQPLRTAALANKLTPSSYNAIPGSGSLPVFGAPVSLSADVPSYTGGSTSLYGVISIPAAGLTTTTNLIELYDTGDAYRWQLVYTIASSGSLNLQGVDTALSVLTESGANAWSVNGAKFVWRISIQNSAGNVNYRITIQKVNDDGSLADVQTTLTAKSTFNHGRISRVILGSLGDLTGSAAGHVAIFSGGGTDGLALQADTLVSNAAVGFPGESAGRRMLRLAVEQNVPLFVVGDADDTTFVGPQRIDTFLNLLRDCEDADDGVLYEPRTMLGLAYRTRTSTYNPATVLGLTYAGEVVAPFEPTDDDQHIRNDVTATRVNGASDYFHLDVGPLSRLSPPNGVGVYDEQVTLNVAFDEQLADQAAWRVYLGTVDAFRFPTIQVNMRGLDLENKSGILQAAAYIDIRDEITVSGPPNWLPPELIELLAEGYTETLDLLEWDITFNCSPGAPWQLGVRDTARRDSGYATLSSSFNAGVATTMSVATSTGPLWTTDGSYMPFDIFVGGVRLTVTAISGASSPQTFTITQTPVNGISRLIPSGTAVNVWRPAIRGL